MAAGVLVSRGQVQKREGARTAKTQPPSAAIGSASKDTLSTLFPPSEPIGTKVERLAVPCQGLFSDRLLSAQRDSATGIDAHGLCA